MSTEPGGDALQKHRGSLDALLDHASDALGLPLEPFQVIQLFGDGSDRKFFRVRKGAFHFVALVSPRKSVDGIDEDDSYLRIGRHLYSVGIPVPQIIHADLGIGFFLLEDFGDRHLQMHALSRKNKVFELYRRVLRLLVQVHRDAREGFMPEYCFDTVHYDPAFVYDRELDYFRSAFLVSLLHLDVGPEDLRPDFENLAEAAGTDDTSFVMHRDFQSRNIMVRRGRLGLLDFQGMRFGPPAYDLASLLIDPYVGIPARMAEALRDFYWSGASGFLGRSYGRFRRDCDILCLCRNLQILGAFAYLGAAKGREQFFTYVPAAWATLRNLLRDRFRGKFPRIEHCVRMAEKKSVPFTERGNTSFA